MKSRRSPLPRKPFELIGLPSTIVCPSSLDALGVPLDFDPDKQAHLLQTGSCAATRVTALDVRHTSVARSDDGLVLVSPFGATHVTEVANGHGRERIVRSKLFDLKPFPPAALDGNACPVSTSFVPAGLVFRTPRCLARQPLRIIAEIKPRSHSAGSLSNTRTVTECAKAYARTVTDDPPALHQKMGQRAA